MDPTSLERTLEHPAPLDASLWSAVQLVCLFLVPAVLVLGYGYLPRVQGWAVPAALPVAVAALLAGLAAVPWLYRPTLRARIVHDQLRIDGLGVMIPFEVGHLEVCDILDGRFGSLAPARYFAVAHHTPHGQTTLILGAVASAQKARRFAEALCRMGRYPLVWSSATQSEAGQREVAEMEVRPPDALDLSLMQRLRHHDAFPAALASLEVDGLQVSYCGGVLRVERREADQTRKWRVLAFLMGGGLILPLSLSPRGALGPLDSLPPTARHVVGAVVILLLLYVQFAARRPLCWLEVDRGSLKSVRRPPPRRHGRSHDQIHTIAAAGMESIAIQAYGARFRLVAASDHAYTPIGPAIDSLDAARLVRDATIRVLAGLHPTAHADWMGRHFEEPDGAVVHWPSPGAVS